MVTNESQIIEYIRKAIKIYDSDNLERTKMAFQNMSEEELDRPYGASKQTCREILQQYQEARDFNTKALEWFELKIRK